MWDGYWNCTVTYCVIVIKHVAFFTIWAKLTMAFTRTSLPLNLYTSVLGCGCGFGFEQIFWRIDGFSEKKASIGGFAYPYSPPSFCVLTKLELCIFYWLRTNEADIWNTTEVLDSILQRAKISILTHTRELNSLGSRIQSVHGMRYPGELVCWLMIKAINSQIVCKRRK